jgi:hypothetical protein
MEGSTLKIMNHDLMNEFGASLAVSAVFAVLC